MDDVEIVVAKCKPLVQAKALAILSTFLKNDQGKQPDEQLPSDVLHQLQIVRDSCVERSDCGDAEEDKAQDRIEDTTLNKLELAPNSAAAAAAAEVVALSSSPEKKRKMKQKKDKA